MFGSRSVPPAMSFAFAPCTPSSATASATLFGAWNWNGGSVGPSPSSVSRRSRAHALFPPLDRRRRVAHRHLLLLERGEQLPGVERQLGEAHSDGVVDRVRD